MTQWVVNLILEGLTVSLKIDTNNYVNILPMSHYKRWKKSTEKADKNTADIVYWW